MKYEEIRARTKGEIKVFNSDDGSTQILHPFCWEDGKHPIVVVKQLGEEWVLSDETLTKIYKEWEEGPWLTNTLKRFGLKVRGDELVLPLQDQCFEVALCQFIAGVYTVGNGKDGKQ